MKDLEQKWQIERDDLEGVSDCINPHTSKFFFFLVIKTGVKICAHLC
jgi:hypothetical protein